MTRKKIPAVAYLRTSSPTNASIGNDKDSDKRQRAAITGFAGSNGYEIVAEFYDVVSGADPIGERRLLVKDLRKAFSKEPDVGNKKHPQCKTRGCALSPYWSRLAVARRRQTWGFERCLRSWTSHELLDPKTELDCSRPPAAPAPGRCGERP
jgi:hypothetical protein